MDLRFGQFNYRVAGVIIEDGHALLHRGERDDHWVLPGGRCQLMEHSRDALARELREELEEEVEVGRLLWFAEMFFGERGQHWHELSMFYEARLAQSSAWRDMTRSYRIEDGGVQLIFQWFPLARAAKINLVPLFLREGLAQLPAAPQHLLIDELSGS